MVYTTNFVSSNLHIYVFEYIFIRVLTNGNIVTTVINKYIDFIHIFSSKLASQLLKQM